MKKRLVALFTFVLIVAGICFFNIKGNMVQATESTETTMYTENDDFVSVYYSEINGYRGSTYSMPEVPEGYEDYLFAGWFGAKTCEKDDALDSSVQDGEAWAKFVPAGVLSVKSQIAQTSTGSYNMRIISTIDTLNYGAVGFKVEYNDNGKIINIPIKEVYTRIKATAESGVDYNFSPKVVNTKSEYFMTATLLNINSEKTGNIFRVVPYWKTMDGTMVNGVNRYVAVDDGIASNDAMSFIVKADAVDLTKLTVTNASDVSIAAENVTYRHVDTTDNYATVVVKGQGKTSLSSATKYVITDGTTSVDAVYRNLETTHIKSGSTSANADQTWYKVYNGIDSTTKEYVIATSADLYGFSTLSKSVQFDNMTVYVVADIKVNDGDATGWSSTAPTYSWTPIGPNGSKFCGTFDAQMHTISGMYASGTTYVGLFAYVRDADCAVKKLRLVNSYFYGSGDYVGSIAGRGAGTFDTIYSEAIVQGGATNGYSRTGGILGQLQDHDGTGTTSTLNNCHFNGSVTGNGLYVGGIVGCHLQGTLNILNCFNENDVTANITTEPTESTYTYTYTAGICGGVMNANNTVTVRDCLNTGDVNVYYYYYDSETETYVSESNAYFLAAGIVNTYKGNFVVERAYDTSNQTSVGRKNSNYSGGTTWRGYWKGDESGITGVGAYLEEATNSAGTVNYGKLDYYTSSNPNGKWIIRENDVPALKSFVSDGIDVAWYYDKNTSGNDMFTISTEEELYGLSALSADLTFEGETINLGDDIKVNNGIASEWAEGTATADRAWTMIGRTSTTPFKGTFDGNGYTIKGIYMNVSDSSTGAGLFGETIDAVIKNFALSNSTFISGTSTAALGSVVGKGDGTFVNLYCDDSVFVDTTASTTVGGIIGSITKGIGTKATTKCTIENCWFDGKISQDVSSGSHVNVGGIVGLQQYGNNSNDNKLTINNCLYTGEMNTTATFTASKNLRAGGIVGGKSGYSDAIFDMSNCLSDGTMTLSKTSTTGGILAGALFGGVASQSDGGENYSNVYATTDCYENALGVYPTNKSASNHKDMTITVDTAANLYDQEANLEYTYLWESSPSETPRLRYYQGTVPVNCEWYVESIGDSADPYLIRTADDLDGVATMTNSGTSFEGETLKLANDIAYNEGTESYTTVEQWETAKSGLNEWTPIGTATNYNKYENAFAGTFDGNEKTISGIYIADGSMIGLFGVTTSDTVIKNLAVTDSYITGSGDYVGTIIGKGAGQLTNVYSDALINSTGTQIGGVVGRSQVSKASDTTLNMTGCWFDGTIVINNNGQMLSGGMIGYSTHGTISLDNCIYSGTINCTSTTTSNLNLRVGGYVGMINSTDNVNSFAISNSLSAGEITATSTNGKTLSQIGSIVGNVGGSLNTTTGADTRLSMQISNVYTTLEGYSKAIGNGLTAGEGIISIEKESTWGVTPCSFQGLDFTNTWVPRKDKAPGLKSFATNDYKNVDYVVADRSWADNTDGGTEENPYIIADAADLLGLSMLALEGNKFDGKTIKVADGVTEIDLNEGWTAGSGAAEIFWNPVGNATYNFKGTFNGNGATIKGVYNNSDCTTYVGLFGYVHPDATLQNFKLKNSHFVQNMGDGASVGSIAAEMRGSVDTVYSEAIIDSASQYSGGLFARVNGVDSKLNETTDEDTGITTTTYDRGTVLIQDTWFGGEMNVSYKGKGDIYRYVGGIIAIVIQGTVDMDHILFTGTIDVADASTRAYAGGIVGATMAQTIESVSDTTVKKFQEDDYTTVNLTSCISAGVVSQHSSQVGAIIGRVESKINTTKNDDDVIIAAYPGPTYLNLEDVFATSECHNQTLHATTTSETVTDPNTGDTSSVTAAGTVTGSVIQSQYNSDRLIGYCTEKVTEDETSPMLDFDTAWTMRTAGVPIPSALEGVVDESTLVANPSGLTAEIGLDYWGSTLTLKDAVNSGKGNYLLNYTVSSDKTYLGFLSYLGNKDFTEYVNNSASTMDDDKVYNTTYVKDNWVLNITYMENLGTVDVIINTFGTTSLSPNLFSSNVEQTDNGSKVKLSMLSLADIGELGEYGNSFVFQLPNGHFIIHDGGKSADAKNLITYLKSLTNGEEVYIDAWVISHFHADHCGALLELYSSDMKEYREGVYLEALYVNEPNNYAKTVESGNVMELAEKALSGVMMFTKAPIEEGKEPETPDVYRIHTGERYYFDGVTMDVVLTQEQIDPNTTPPIDTSTLPYRFYGDWDPFNATSTTCVFTVNSTKDKIYMGGDSNRVNMNYIMQAYDNEEAYMYVTHEYSSGSYDRYTEKISGTINQTSSSTLSDITVFVALHHGKNTSNGFIQYLFGDTDAADDSLDVVLFPYHQMYSATYEESKTVDGVTYANRYWMEDNSSVFEYLIETYNQNLYASADGKYYTYGYEDCTGATADNPHGTVELTFTSTGITTNFD